MPLRPQPWLLPLSWLYGAVVGWRNRRLDAAVPSRLPVPVVSIGNLGAGGTGKTPFTAWLVADLRAAGLRPGVLARGYGRRPGETLNDEGRLLQRRFADLPQEQDPERYAAGQRLLAREACDVLLLDDGFQHRRLHRDVDYCLMDAEDPLSGGRMLPAGWLRESPRGLARASAVVLTSARPVDADRYARSEEQVRRYLPAERPIYRAQLQPSRCECLPSGESGPAAEVLEGRRVLLVAGIARPERFVRLAERLGAVLVGQRIVADHRRVQADALAALAREAAEANATLLWTEKDEARHAFAAGEGPERIVLFGELEFVGAAPDLHRAVCAAEGEHGA
jgi:tetraacyldisaccharide 4'-kinase